MKSFAYDQIPSAVVQICERLQRRGHQAYMVGGSVRDLLLARKVTDWDVATSARPEQVQRAFSKTIPTGIQHGTITVLMGRGLAVEVTTLRGEGTYSDGRHPDAVEFLDDLQQDLRRRDLTVNAIAVDPVRQQLHDPLGGLADLREGVIRAVGDPRQRFEEDRLRPLRALRCATTLEFTVEPDTLAAVCEIGPRLGTVASERVRDELFKLLGARQPSVGLELIEQTGLLPHVLPELAETSPSKPPMGEGYRHGLRMCDALVPDPILRLAALLCAPRDPKTRGAEASIEGSARACEGLAGRLRLSRAQRERLCRLVAQPWIDLGLSGGPELRRLIHRVGQQQLEEVLALQEAGLVSLPDSADDLEALRQLRQRIAETLAGRPVLEVRQLVVDGRMLIERLGRAPGPWLGRLLDALLERVLDDPALNERARLLELAEGLASSPSPERRD